MKSKNAISLIVLVITILVLAIIATTVIVVLKNTNIIENASDSVTDYNESQQKESLNMMFSNSKIICNENKSEEDKIVSLSSLFGEGKVVNNFDGSVNITDKYNQTIAVALKDGEKVPDISDTDITFNITGVGTQDTVEVNYQTEDNENMFELLGSKKYNFEKLWFTDTATTALTLHYYKGTDKGTETGKNNNYSLCITGGGNLDIDITDENSNSVDKGTLGDVRLRFNTTVTKKFNVANTGKLAAKYKFSFGVSNANSGTTTEGKENIEDYIFVTIKDDKGNVECTGNLKNIAGQSEFHLSAGETNTYVVEITLKTQKQ